MFSQFNNRRAREKLCGRLAAPSPRKGRKYPRATTRKVSSTSTNSDNSSIDLRSDSGADSSPAQSTAAVSPLEGGQIDRYLASLQTPSPPSTVQPTYDNNLLFDSTQFFAVPPPATSAFQQPPLPQTSSNHLLHPSQPISFDQSQTALEQMHIPMPFADPSWINLDIDAGIGDDFWKKIMEAAGLSLDKGTLDPVDQLKGVTVPPEAIDWSHVFLNLDAGSMQQDQ